MQRILTMIRRSSWPERWVSPQNRPSFPGGAHSGSSSAGPPPEDLSHPECWLRYASFVLSILVVASAAMLATPALLLAMSRCPFGCLSLENDLIRSINTSVHPCNDFYEHVCNGWDRRGGGHPGNPLRRYISAFERAAVKSLLLEPTPQRLTSVKQLATAFIVRCLNSEYPASGLPPGAWSVHEKVLQFMGGLSASDVLPNASEQEIQDVYIASVAAHLGSHTAVTLQSSDPQAVPTSGQFAAGVKEDLKLFFLLNCFAHCGTIGRLRQNNVAICNLALPAAPFFRRAFNCGRQHRLTTDFTWRDFTTEGGQ